MYYSDAAIIFLQKIIEEIGLEQRVIRPDEKRPILVATWLGKEPNLPSILLNSHTDVVPVYADQWKHDPFGAHKDEQGRIYGRGTQDRKCVTIQYLEAIRRLKKRGVTTKRTIHLTFLPGLNSQFSFIYDYIYITISHFSHRRRNRWETRDANFLKIKRMARA